MRTSYRTEFMNELSQLFAPPFPPQIRILAPMLRLCRWTCYHSLILGSLRNIFSHFFPTKYYYYGRWNDGKRYLLVFWGSVALWLRFCFVLGTVPVLWFIFSGLLFCFRNVIVMFRLQFYLFRRDSIFNMMSYRYCNVIIMLASFLLFFVTLRSFFTITSWFSLRYDFIFITLL